MSKPIKSLSPGYYPALPPSAHNQIITNPIQQNFRFLEQLNTPTSILPTNIQVPTQIPVQRATKVAQSSLRRSPYPMLSAHYYPKVPPGPLFTAAQISPLYAPVLQRPSASNTQAATSTESPNPSNKMTYHPLEIEEIDPHAPGFSLRLEAEQEIRNRINKGIPLIEQHRYHEGIQLFREAFLIDASSFIFSLFLAWQKIVCQMRPQILQHVEAALALNPKDPDALLLKGLCHIETGKYGIAVEAFRSIVSNDPSDPFAKALLKEITLMYKRNMPVPVKNDQAELASVRKRMAITALIECRRHNRRREIKPSKTDSQ